MHPADCIRFASIMSDLLLPYLAPLSSGDSLPPAMPNASFAAEVWAWIQENILYPLSGKNGWIVCEADGRLFSLMEYGEGLEPQWDLPLRSRMKVLMVARGLDQDEAKFYPERALSPEELNDKVTELLKLLGFSEEISPSVASRLAEFWKTRFSALHPNFDQAVGIVVQQLLDGIQSLPGEARNALTGILKQFHPHGIELFF